MNILVKSSILSFAMTTLLCGVSIQAFAAEDIVLEGDHRADSDLLSGGDLDCDAHGAKQILIEGIVKIVGIDRLRIRCDEVHFGETAFLYVAGDIDIVARRVESKSYGRVVSVSGNSGRDAPANLTAQSVAQSGSPGAHGTKGRNASSGVRWENKRVGFFTTKLPVTYSDGAHHGEPGKPGADNAATGLTGAPGADGENGLAGGRVSLTIESIDGTLALVARGGDGGEGGKGGPGGQGGTGGTGGHGGRGGDGILDHGPKNGGVGGRGGKGGLGGIGGLGGDGGDGGSGGVISVQLVRGLANEHFTFDAAGGAGGEPGEGGTAGIGGLPGKGGPGGCGGNSGSGDLFRSDGRCGGWGGNGLPGGVGQVGRPGEPGLPGVAGVPGVFDAEIVPLEDFEQAYGET